MTLPFLISYAALWVLVVLQGVVLLGLVRLVAQLNASRLVAPAQPGEPLPQGTPIPAFEAVDMNGNPVRSTDFKGHTRALLFVSGTCEACALTIDEMGALYHKADHRVTVICRGTRGECEALVARRGIEFPMVADDRYEISDLFGISQVPTAVLVNRADRIQQYGHPQRENQLEEILEEGEQTEADAGLEAVADGHR